jgi:hypothetical protein
VLRASVAREDVIALFTERLETEIVTLPEHVTIKAVDDVHDKPAAPPASHVDHVEIEGA